MMIARQWTGLCYSAKAVSYIQHLQTETFPALNNIKGFISGSILHRQGNSNNNNNSHIEFIITTTWASMEAIKEFAGENYTIAVVPEKVQQMMITWNTEVSYYTLI